MLTGCGGTGVCSRGVHLLQLRESFQLIDYLLGRRGSLYKKHDMSVSFHSPSAGPLVLPNLPP